MSVLTEYMEAKKRLYKHFNYEGFAYGVEDGTEAYWKLEGGDVKWAVEDWTESGESEYTNEARVVYRAGDLTMIFVRDAFGDKFMQIFDNTKEIK